MKGNFEYDLVPTKSDHLILKYSTSSKWEIKWPYNIYFRNYQIPAVGLVLGIQENLVTLLSLFDTFFHFWWFSVYSFCNVYFLLFYENAVFG